MLSGNEQRAKVAENQSSEREYSEIAVLRSRKSRRGGPDCLVGRENAESCVGGKRETGVPSPKAGNKFSGEGNEGGEKQERRWPQSAAKAGEKKNIRHGTIKTGPVANIWVAGCGGEEKEQGRIRRSAQKRLKNKTGVKGTNAKCTEDPISSSGVWERSESGAVSRFKLSSPRRIVEDIQTVLLKKEGEKPQTILRAREKTATGQNTQERKSISSPCTNAKRMSVLTPAEDGGLIRIGFAKEACTGKESTGETHLQVAKEGKRERRQVSRGDCAYSNNYSG